MKLDDEQRKLVEDNHNLIYLVLHRYSWPIDEYYDIAAIGLCQAAYTFDTEKGFKFSTYACTCILNSVRMNIRYEHTKVRYNPTDVHLQDEIAEGITIGDTLPANVYGDPERHAIATDALDAIQRLPDGLRAVANATIEGYSQKEIASKVGTSQVNVCRWLGKARKKLEIYA